MTSPEDDIPLPSDGLLSDEETIRQLRADSVRAYTDRIRYLEAKLEETKPAIEICERWTKDSSLKAWFPFTAEELEQLRSAARNMAEALRQTMGHIDGEHPHWQAGYKALQEYGKAQPQDASTISRAVIPTQKQMFELFMRDHEQNPPSPSRKI